MRQKYAFKTRQDAEDAYRQADAKATEFTRALTAIYRDDVRYLPRFGPYLFGLFWMEKGNGHIILRQPGTDATPICLDAEEFFDHVRLTNGNGFRDADLERAAYSVRRIRSAVWNGAELPQAIRDEFSTEEDAAA